MSSMREDYCNASNSTSSSSNSISEFSSEVWPNVLINILTERKLPETFFRRYRSTIVFNDPSPTYIIQNGPFIFNSSSKIAAQAEKVSDYKDKALLLALAIVQAREEANPYLKFLSSLEKLCIEHHDFGMSPKTLITIIIESDTYTLSLAEAQKNNAYWDFIGNAFRKCYALPIIEKYIQNIEPDETKWRGIREPKNDSLLQLIVEKIEKGELTDLPFEHVHFKRFVIKAYRHRSINLNQLCDLILLKDASDLMQGKIRSYEVNETTNEYLSPSENFVTQKLGLQLKYPTEKQHANFYEHISSLDSRDRKVFTIDFSSEKISMMLIAYFDYLSLEVNNNKKLLNFFKRFKVLLDSHLNNEIQKDERDTIQAKLIIHLDNLLNETNKFLSSEVVVSCELISDSAREVKSILCQALKIENSSYLNRNLSSFKLQLNILYLEEPLPLFLFNPTYYQSEPALPLLSFILPSTAVTYAFMKAYHPESIVKADYLFGPVDTRMIFADGKEVFVSYLKRKMEMISADIWRKSKVHGREVDNFTFSFHDRFHVIRTSSNPYLRLTYYMAVCQERAKQVEMSPGIWKIADMDFQVGQIIRNSNCTEVIAILRVVFFILNSVQDSFLKNENYKDLELLFIVDMILNQNQWQTYSGFTPEEIFSCAKEPFKTNFKNLYDKLKIIIRDNGIDQIPDYHIQILMAIVMYRIEGSEDNINLAREIQPVGFNNLFKWSKKSGIYINIPPNVVEQLNLPSKPFIEDFRNPNELVKLILLVIRSMSQALQVEVSSSSSIIPNPIPNTDNNIQIDDQDENGDEDDNAFDRPPPLSPISSHSAHMNLSLFNENNSDLSDKTSKSNGYKRPHNSIQSIKKTIYSSPHLEDRNSEFISNPTKSVKKYKKLGA